MLQRIVLVTLALSTALLCSCSATTLRCGTDGESSYVDLVNVPQDISAAVREYKDLCGFTYEGEKDET